MKVNVKHSLLAAAVAAALAAPAAYATNGYFKEGYGTKSRGLAGASVAYAQDSLAPASNPAGLTGVGNRVDGGIELFNPNRDGSLDGRGIGGAASDVESGATVFAIPNAGFAMDLSGMSVGFAMVANGGMNTRYNTNIYDQALAPAAGAPVGFLPNTSTLGVNLAQLLMLPTVAYKINQDHSIGASLVVGYQTFRAYGLGDFAAFGFSSDPANLTNKGDDTAWGAGGRLGWTGQLTSSLTVGATYSSKVYMQEFDHYKGLFAEQGDFDIPANYAVGIALKASPDVTVAFDVQRIEYGDVPAIANAGPSAAEFLGAFAAPINPARLLGTDGGFGFGWEDITIYKLGVDYAYNSQWTLRGGVNIGENPIDPDQNLFNILAPGLVEKHLALGFTYSPNQNNELSMTYMHAFREDQSYTYAMGPASYTAEIGMDQNSIEASYAWKF